MNQNSVLVQNLLLTADGQPNEAKVSKGKHGYASLASLKFKGVKFMDFHFRPLEGGYEVPMRLVGANIYFEWLVYLLALIPIGFFLYGACRRIMIWKKGQGDVHRNDQIWRRISSWLYFTFVHRQVLRKPSAGWLHFMLFWGFVFLFIATASFALWNITGFPPLVGGLYVGLSMIVDILGFLAIIGIIGLAYIRYVKKPDRLNDTKPLDGWILLLIFSILLTGYVVEGLRIAGQIQLSANMQQITYEQMASPVGWLFAGLFGNMPLESILSWHRFNWWFHMAISFLFIAIIPYSKLWHIFTGMIGYFARDFRPSAARMMENIEEAEHYGVENIEEFSWKDLMDLDACIRCGRCQENCPAYLTGKALNPKMTVIQDMKKHLDAKSPYLLKGQASDTGDLALTSEEALAHPTEASLLYDIVTPRVLWQCTNCRACVEHCPMFIEHLHKIIEMRRNLVMWQGDMPSEAQNTFTNLERNYNPWGVGWVSRADWLKERGVRELVKLLPEEGGEFDYLLFGGCAVAFDDRYKKAGEALLRCLNQVGIKVGYLGTEEVCCGDPARRLGNEYLHQTLAAQNIDNFNKYGVKKIICLCPHGYNSLKNEYPQMGGNYEVYHSTQILTALIQEGKLKPKGKEMKAYKISYHDSCFLGRHNRVYNEPRQVLAASGASIKEVEKSREFGFCCGAGGGRMFLEEETVDGFRRINEERTVQLLETHPDYIATNCPYCMTMIIDGLKSADREDVQVLDVCEFLWRSL